MVTTELKIRVEATEHDALFQIKIITDRMARYAEDAQQWHLSEVLIKKLDTILDDYEKLLPKHIDTIKIARGRAMLVHNKLYPRIEK